MDTKRNWHAQVPGFNRGNETGTERNRAYVENDFLKKKKKGTDKSYKQQASV